MNDMELAGTEREENPFGKRDVFEPDEATEEAIRRVSRMCGQDPPKEVWEDMRAARSWMAEMAERHLTPLPPDEMEIAAARALAGRLGIDIPGEVLSDSWELKRWKRETQGREKATEKQKAYIRSLARGMGVRDGIRDDMTRSDASAMIRELEDIRRHSPSL